MPVKVEADWLKRARCAGLAFTDPGKADRMFFSGAKPKKAVVEFCYGCEVRETCFAVGSSASHGVWGGFAAHTIAPGLVDLRSTRMVGVPVPWSRDRIKMVRRRVRAGESKASICAELSITMIELIRVTEGMQHNAQVQPGRRSRSARSRRAVDDRNVAA